MVTAAFAGTYRGIAISAFNAVCATVQFLTAETKATVVTECTHTAFAEPALAAKTFLVGEVAVVTTEAVPTVVDITILAGHTVAAPYGFGKTFTALVTMG